MQPTKTVHIPEKALPLLKDGWRLELKILEADIIKFKNRVMQLEKTHRMASRKFQELFGKGELGDEDWCFDWANYLEILSELEEKKQAAQSITW